MALVVHGAWNVVISETERDTSEDGGVCPGGWWRPTMWWSVG